MRWLDSVAPQLFGIRCAYSRYHPSLRGVTVEPTLAVIGLNFWTPPVAVRERFWIAEPRRYEALHQPVHSEGIASSCPDHLQSDRVCRLRQRCARSRQLCPPLPDARIPIEALRLVALLSTDGRCRAHTYFPGGSRTGLDGAGQVGDRRTLELRDLPGCTGQDMLTVAAHRLFQLGSSNMIGSHTEKLAVKATHLKESL
jgi:hypothetical protein